MPLTYLSHQAAVLPLKMWRPTWFDGTALVFGSMAPDWAYVFNGSRVSIDAHRWPADLWFAVPVSVLATLLVRRLEPQLVAALPWRPTWVRDLAHRRPASRSFVVLAACAAVGVATHIVWDAFTHDSRWGAQHVGWLRQQVTIGGHSLSRAHLLQQVSTVGGALVTLALLAVVGHRRSVLAWRRQERHAPRARSDPRVLATTAIGGIIGLWWAHDAQGDVAAAVNRFVLTTGFAFIAAAALFVRDNPVEDSHADQS